LQTSQHHGRRDSKQVGMLFVCLARFMAKWIEETVRIISLVSDRSGFGLIKSYEGNDCWRRWDIQFAGVDWQNFVCLARFTAQLIEEIKPIISVVSDRSGLGVELSYEGISGTRGDGISVQYDFDHTIWQKLFELGWLMFRFTEETSVTHFHFTW
jgi:hypothetical protein